MEEALFSAPQTFQALRSPGPLISSTPGIFSTRGNGNWVILARNSTGPTDVGGIWQDSASQIRFVNAAFNAAVELTANTVTLTGTNTNVSGSLRARTRPLTTTTGTLVVADANCAGTLTGGITLPNSVFTAGDMQFFNAGGANRTITRGAGIAMHLNGVDVASATLNANTGGGVFWESASKAILTGAFV